MTGPPISYMRRDGSIDNTAAIAWWTEKRRESKRPSYRLRAWWASVTCQAVPPDTRYIEAHIALLASQDRF